MSKKIYFMRDKDITTVNENVDNIIEKARNREIQIIEPTLDEFKQVRSIILEFIKKEKRIIYGGYAWNSLVKKVNPSDAFYKDTDYTDIEFYSNKPVEDMKKICDILYAKGFNFIQGKSAQHEDTYTIFVNFTGYCDISYMPSNVFYGVQTANIDGLRLIHPKFIMVDILRQFNDPMTSFWRLDKNIKRGKLIMKNYPLELSTKPFDMKKLNPNTIKLVDFLIQHLAKSNSMLFIGQIANNAYLNPNPNVDNQVSVYDQTPLELISTNVSKDVKLIYNTIIKYFLDTKQAGAFEDKIVLEQYYPFFQFTDKKAVFKYEGETFLIIYGNNEKCIPYNDIKLVNKDKPFNIKIGTFNVNFMFNLVRYHQAYADKDKNVQGLQDYIMSSLLDSRDKFLESNDLTVLDNSIFEDFKVNCLGDPVSPMRKFMMSRRDRKLMPRSAIHPYDPQERKDNYDTDIYHFHNYSGNIINNPRDLIFNTKKDKEA